MSQIDVLNLLKKKRGKWLCSDDFVIDLNISRKSVSQNIMRIKKRPEMFNVNVSVKGKKHKVFLRFL